MEVADWRWVFLATALIGVAGFLLVWISATESKDPESSGLDWPGALSFTAALSVFTYAILLAPEEGWHSAWVLGMLLTSVVLFIVFVRIERRVARPMLDLSLFDSGRFVGVQVLAASPAFYFVTLIVMLPGRFIGIDGLSALEAGQMMIALAAPLLVVPFVAALLSRWFTSGVLSGVGLMVVAVALVWLGQVVSGGAGPALVAPLVMIGAGIGLPWGLMDGMAVSVTPTERAGMATGIFNCVRVSADGLAIAVAGALLAFLIQGGLLGTLAGTDPAVVIEAANRAALGDLAYASALVSGERAVLLATYDQALRWVLYSLAGSSALTALLVFALLGKSRAHEEVPAAV